MGARDNRHVLGRLFWHLNGPRGRVIPLQRHRRADVLRVDHVVLGHRNPLWEAGGDLADCRGVGGVFDCVELRGVKTSPQIHGGREHILTRPLKQQPFHCRNLCKTRQGAEGWEESVVKRKSVRRRCRVRWQK